MSVTLIDNPFDERNIFELSNSKQALKKHRILLKINGKQFLRWEQTQRPKR